MIRNALRRPVGILCMVAVVTALASACAPDPTGSGATTTTVDAGIAPLVFA